MARYTPPTAAETAELLQADREHAWRMNVPEVDHTGAKLLGFYRGEMGWLIPRYDRDTVPDARFCSRKERCRGLTHCPLERVCDD